MQITTLLSNSEVQLACAKYIEQKGITDAVTHSRDVKFQHHGGIVQATLTFSSDTAFLETSLKQLRLPLDEDTTKSQLESVRASSQDIDLKPVESETTNEESIPSPKSCEEIPTSIGEPCMSDSQQAPLNGDNQLSSLVEPPLTSTTTSLTQPSTETVAAKSTGKKKLTKTSALFTT